MKIAFAGDLVLQELKKDPSYIFGSVAEFLILNKVRLCINLESPFVQSEMSSVKNKITLCSETGNVNYLQFLNPYLINLSNNHVNDYGDCSGRLTCDILRDKSLPYYGIGYPEEKNHIHVDKESKCIQIAFTTRSADLSGEALFSDVNFIGPYAPDLSLIKFLRKEHPDYSIVVNVHWGIEDITYPEPEKRNLAYEIIDAGADLIIGHHPHIIQPVEIYKGKYIFYSLGNFYFPNIHYQDKGILKHKKSKNHQKIGLLPIFDISNGDISIVMTLKVRILKNGQLTFSRYRGRKLIPSNSKIYKIIHGYYLKCFEVKRLIVIVLNNPSLILKKILLNERKA